MSLPEAHGGIVYTQFMSELAKRRAVRTYLEIGVENGFCLSQMQVDCAVAIDPFFKLSVDPTVGKKKLFLNRMTSDEFFRDQRTCLDLDCAFLDGLHVFEFLLRDFYNVERHCTRNAIIAIHDALPLDGRMISRSDTGAAWTGDVWKIIPILRRYRPDLTISLVDCAPTGLVIASNLNPTSDTLRRNYSRIVEEYIKVPNNEDALHNFYGEETIISAEKILNEHDHTLYFAI